MTMKSDEITCNVLRGRMITSGISSKKAAVYWGVSQGWLSRVISGKATGPAADKMRGKIENLVQAVEDAEKFNSFDESKALGAH